jgi:CRISPR-associated endonuclease/helicase Cas3
MSTPSFSELYQALYDRGPFPWQVRLAEIVLTDGWPSLLDLPTGAGKTSALDIALYCLARAPQNMPRRTLLVVDRRIVVDQGAQHARRLLQTLWTAEDGPAKWAADALRATWNASSEDPPLAIAVMRGGMPRDNDWAKRPDQPVLGVSTIDQVGSRLLFRGYGVSSLSASIHAGLLGNDLLLLLDEVHLAVPFAQTLEAIRQRYRTADAKLPARFRVVQMSATAGGAPSGSTRFQLDTTDRNHPVLGERLRTHKGARLVSVKVAGDEERKRHTLAEHVVREAAGLRETGAKVIGIVVNRVDTARLALTMATKLGKSILLTGRMRPLDRDAVVNNELIPAAGAGRDRSTAQPVFVIATQCIEAGADLDFDAIVTECASIDALRQRFGRVDRRGELRESSSVIVGRSDQISPTADDDPIYGGALGETWRWLETVATKGVIDFGIDAMDAHIIPAATLPPRTNAPVLMPAHLDAWAQTSQLPANDPDVSLWLHGPGASAADVQVVWRENASPDGVNADTLIERLAACRPSSLEAMTIPIGAAKRWLSERAVSAIADVVAGDAEPLRPIRRRDHSPFVALRWRGDRGSSPVAVDDIAPGDVLVVDANTAGGIAANSFDPTATAPVSDLGALAQLRGRGLATLWLPRRLDLPPDDELEETTSELRARVRDWLASQSTPLESFRGTGDEWNEALAAWRSRRARIELVGDSVVVTAPLRRRDLETEDAVTEDDDSLFRGAEITLSTHSHDVRSYAERFALVDDLALAGWFHDIGKADPRFQRWLVGGSEVRAALLEAPLAKSALPPGNRAERQLAQRRAGYPKGSRHELLSLDMIARHTDILARAHDRELVLHLVASHHGWCRPFAPPIDHPEEIVVTLNHGDTTLQGNTRHRAAQLDSGTAERFWNLTTRYGWWGLAWLEAALRLADHRASEDRAYAGEEGAL